MNYKNSTVASFRPLCVFLCVLCAFAAHLPAAAPEDLLYANDFEKVPEGDPPGDVVVLNGTFAVKSADNNKFLEVGGEPVDAFGVFFGPEGKAYLSVSAKIYATAVGKRTPEFGVGLADTNGYKLWVMPAKGELQILKGEEVKAALPLAWKSGSWTSLKLQARKTAEGKTVVEGKAWEQGQEEPKDFAVKFEEAEEVPKGRASAWASPYSGTPIRFDNFLVMKTGEE